MLRNLRVNSLLTTYKNVYQCSSRIISTSHTSFGFFGPPKEEPLIKRVARKLGWSETSKGSLTYAGYTLYIKVAEELDYKEFFEICDMEDTFLSWFKVLELHVWMLSARLMEEGAEGRHVRNSMIKAMWEDNDVRSKKLEGALAAARREQIQELNQTFQASIFAYDEGLLGSDRVLAGAIWRRFLRGKEPQTQEELLKQIVAVELLVLYVRYQFKQLNKLTREDAMLKHKFKFIPFNKDLFNLAEKSKIV